MGLVLASNLKYTYSIFYVIILLIPYKLLECQVLCFVALVQSLLLQNLICTMSCTYTFEIEGESIVYIY